MSVLCVAELGGNHNGDLGIAAKMVETAVRAGADAIKLQKRDLDLAIPEDQKQVLRETPWGTLPYIDYRRKLEFEAAEWEYLYGVCNGLGVPLFGSAWDIPSAEFLLRYTPVYIKVPSAKITDLDLLRYIEERRGPVHPIISTGMSTLAEVRQAVAEMPSCTVLHCNSTYPCPNEELNLRVIRRYQMEFPNHQVGYSGHERGIAASVAAVALGAEMVERHFTLDRTMWGTDQSSSLEPTGFARLVKDIRVVEAALGDSNKRVYPSEAEARRKLRG